MNPGSNPRSTTQEPSAADEIMISLIFNSKRQHQILELGLWVLTNISIIWWYPRKTADLP
jgi:hypothetical protein